MKAPPPPPDDIAFGKQLLKKFIAQGAAEAKRGPFTRPVNVGRVPGHRFIKQLRKKVRRRRAT